MSHSSKVHAIVYVPGLGDHRVRGQQLAVKSWKVQDVDPYLFQMNWMDGEALQPKLDRLVQLIDSLHEQGKKVSLIGASAGASAVLNAYAIRQDRINGVVSICGKIQSHGIDSVHTTYYDKNPAFLTSMQQLPNSEEMLDSGKRSRILSMHPMFDESVPVSETKLPGSVPRVMPVSGHFFGIAYGLTIGSFGAIRFLKKLPENI